MIFISGITLDSVRDSVKSEQRNNLFVKKGHLTDFKMKAIKSLAAFSTIIATTVIVLIVVVSVKMVTSEDKGSNETEISTKYPILIPRNSYNEVNYTVEFLELSNETAIDWSEFRSCGDTMEDCGGSIEDSSVNNRNDNLIDFRATPMYCRCDEKCLKYGDCCVTILKKVGKVPKHTYWRCVKLLNSAQAVRMISKCPDNYAHDLNKELCENPICPSIEIQSSYTPLCPLLDVPVLNNKTGDLYRSIFCARCHSLSKHEMFTPNHSVFCSNFSSRIEWEDFKVRAVYRPGELKWSDPSNSSIYCKLYIEEFEPLNIQNLVPDVRFCPLSISNNEVKETPCSPELSSEENLILRKLCLSYMQLVEYSKSSKEVYSYKNPHCAKCDNPSLDIKSKKSIRCSRGRQRGAAPTIQTRFFAPVDTGPVGINILFHFSLDMDDGYVGYTSKCDEDEILDFIRNKCVPVICPKGYELYDGKCEEIIDESSLNQTSSSVGQGSNNHSSSLISNSSEPCFLIILNAGEYLLLPNGSLLVNQSRDSALVVFQPGEYEKYNGSTMSICAEDVDQTYEKNFAPALSYLSNILLAFSVIFLLLHVILYIVLPKMRNLPGNNLLCLTTCLLISQFIFLTMINATNRVLCVLSSVTMHYFFLASFFWMNIMSFDIWRTFSNEFLVRRYSGDSAKTFLKYSLFAWITPLLIVVLAVITDFSLPSNLIDSEYGPFVKKLRPLYGHNNLCWITQRLSLFVFFAFPVALIILCNFVLFTLTAVTILALHREGGKFINGSTSKKPISATLSKSDPKNNNKVPLHGCNSSSTKKSDEVRLKLYAKLALIMGLTWILGFLSALWEWLWYPFVFFNGLQGTFIFVAFDLKYKVWYMVKEEFGWKKKSKKTNTAEENDSSDLKRCGTTTLSSTVRSSSSSQGEVSNGKAHGAPVKNEKTEIA